MILMPAIAVAAFLGYALGWWAGVMHVKRELVAMAIERAQTKEPSGRFIFGDDEDDE